MVFPKGLNSSEKDKLELAIAFVKESLAQAESGHDWWHIVRVWNNAMHLCEKRECNIFLIGLGVLLHDIADPKFYDGDTEVGPETAEIFLKKIGVSDSTIKQVVDIVRFSSFSASKAGLPQPDFIEFKVVQDADRLDALGAIGIARTFNYGGYKNNALYLPELEESQVDNSSLQHFYDKLFKLKELMHTPEAKAIAEERHKYMQGFVKQFLLEWNGKA